MKSELSIKLVLILIIAIILIQNISALGVTPGRTTLNFEAGLEKTVELTILNTENKDFNALIYIEGDLKDYIQLDKEEISFLKEQESNKLKYNVKLPNTLSPGLNTANIIIREVPKESEGELTVNALVAVISQLHVNAPYPGKYVKADLNIVEANVNETVRFFIPLTSLGDEDTNVKAIISIQDAKEIAKLETETINLKSKERKELSAIWNANIPPGIYKAVAFVYYEDRIITIEKEFLIGNFFLKPLDISVKNFKLGEVAKFDILMENIGNKQINDAYSQIKLEDNEKLIADLKSEKVSIAPNEKKSAILFWDTENIQQGTYDGKLALNYEGKSIERLIRSSVSQNSINTEIIGITGQVVAPIEVSNKKTAFLWITIFILIIVNIILVRKFKKNSKV